MGFDWCKILELAGTFNMATAAPQINTGTSLDSVVGSIQDPVERAILKGESQREKKVEDFTEKKIAERDSLEPPKPPTLIEAPKQEDYKTDPMKTFGSAAMFLAAFGGLLTKAPLETALNAGAEVMNAVNKNDAAAFSKAFDKWKIDSENAWKMAEFNQKQYKDALGKSDEDVKLYATMFKNETAGLALSARMHEQDLKAQEKALSNAKKSTAIVTEYIDNGMAEFNKSHPDATEMERAQAKLDLFGEAKNRESGFYAKEEYKQTEKKKASISDDTAKFAADQVLAGDKSALSNYGRGEKATANLALIHEKVQEMAKARGVTGADLAKINTEFAGFQSEQRIVGSRAGAVTFAAAEVDQLMPLAKKAVSQIDLSGFPDVAALQNYARKHSGDQRYQFAYDTLQELQNAYTSLLVRNGVRSDAAQKLSESVINLNMGKRNIAGAFDAISQSKNAIMASAPAARKAILEDMSVALGGKKTDVKEAIPENYIQWLIKNPTAENKKSFDAHFGEGASDNVLSGVPTSE